MRLHHLSILGFVACAAPAPARAPAQVRPGIDVLLADSAHLIAGQRLGLLTNQGGVTAAGQRDVDVLRSAGYRVAALFSPEHGFQGREDRSGLRDATDSASGLPIYSLYGGTPLSHVATFDSLDVVLIDLPDIGARYWTYPATATQLMREAARRGKPVLVLDRPNPIGGEIVQGNVRAHPADPDTTFVGFLPVAMRHGMTLGELLRLANVQFHLRAALTVVPAAGWRRALYFDEAGLPWVRPSPNMPDLESAIHYPGTCLFEGTNLSVGRGTPRAFQIVGAPWLDTAAVLARLRHWGTATGEGLVGVELSGTVFTPRAPTDGKYDGVELRGIQVRVVDRRRYDPTRTAVALLAALRAVHRDSFAFNTRFDGLAAGPALRQALSAGRAPATIWRSWEPALTRFRRARASYLLY